MNKFLRKFVERVLLIPIVEDRFRIIFQFYKNEFYKRFQSGQIDIMLDILDIKENFSNSDAKALIGIVKMVLKNGLQIVEIGSWKGFSTLDYNGKIFAVDHWKGSENVSNHGYAKMIDIFKIFEHNRSC